MTDTTPSAAPRLFETVLGTQEQVLRRIEAEYDAAKGRLVFLQELEQQWPPSVPAPLEVGLRSHPSVVLAPVADYLDALFIAESAKALPLVVELKGQTPTRPASPKPPTVRVTPAPLAGTPHAIIGAELFASRRTYCQPDMLYQYPINLNHVLTCEHTNHDSVHSWALVFWMSLEYLPSIRVTVPLKNTPRGGGGVTPPAQYNSVIRHSWGEDGCYTYFYEVPAR